MQFHSTWFEILKLCPSSNPNLSMWQKKSGKLYCPKHSLDLVADDFLFQSLGSILEVSFPSVMQKLKWMCTMCEQRQLQFWCRFDTCLLLALACDGDYLLKNISIWRSRSPRFERWFLFVTGHGHDSKTSYNDTFFFNIHPRKETGCTMSLSHVLQLKKKKNLTSADCTFGTEHAFPLQSLFTWPGYGTKH